MPKNKKKSDRPNKSEVTLDEGEVIELDSFETITDPVTEPGTAVTLDSNGDRAFGVEDAIRLLNSLPAAPNVEMVVRLMRVTSGSVNVSGQEMSDELARRQTLLESTIGAALRQAQLLEQQLQAKRDEIAGQQAELKQLANVRTKLLVAMEPASRRPPPIPSDAIKPVYSRPSRPAAE